MFFSLSQAPESRLDPFVNMLAGLIFYQLWYSGIPEETQLRNSDIHMASDANGTDSNDVPYVKPEQDDCSNNHSSVAMQDVKFPAQSDIVKSKANRPSEQCHHESSTSEFSMKPSAEMVEDEASSFNHDNNFIDASVSFPYGNLVFFSCLLLCIICFFSFFFPFFFKGNIDKSCFCFLDYVFHCACCCMK